MINNIHLRKFDPIIDVLCFGNGPVDSIGPIEVNLICVKGVLHPTDDIDILKEMLEILSKRSSRWDLIAHIERGNFKDVTLELSYRAPRNESIIKCRIRESAMNTWLVLGRRMRRNKITVCNKQAKTHTAHAFVQVLQFLFSSFYSFLFAFDNQGSYWCRRWGTVRDIGN